MKITINHVADKAGVSIATVSRVLNGTANVDALKRLRVEEAVQTLGFRPNSIARSLSRKKSNTIGLIVPTIVNPFFNAIAESVEKRAREKGYKIILCNSNNDAINEKKYIESLLQNQIDAFVIISDNKIDQNFSVPVVYLDRYSAVIGNNHPIIRSDHYKGGMLATKHLISKGCKKIAYIGKEKIYTKKYERIDGFLDTMEENNLQSIIQQSEYNYEAGLDAVKVLLDEHNDLEGIFAGNDLIAYAVIKEAFNRGISIPKDLKLVGYDNIMFSELITPSLTTIEQPVENLGKLAVDVILDILNDRRIMKNDIVLPVELIERDTTK
jgi:LacI family transcriptional regulator